MTIAIALKVGDGVVLGADSAATLSGDGGVANVYFNAEKLTNLVKGLPLGMVTYGLGGLDGRSVTSLSRDLRELLSGTNPEWHLDPSIYTMQWVAERVRQFFYEDHYANEYPQKGKDAQGNPFDKAVSGKAVWAGVPEALDRLFGGWSSQVYRGMLSAGLPAKDVEQFLNSLPMEPLISSAMPLQDAIDLVKYMVDVTVGFVRFIPGPPTVAEPVDIAAITKHEGFRWVRRKHYYSIGLNPARSSGTSPDPGH